MARPPYVELDGGKRTVRIPILYEDRSVIAIDKPAGWLLIPFSWQSTQRNLHAAITSSIAAGDFWARSRNLRFLRHVHRLDGDTSGVLLMAKNPGAAQTYSDLFESRRMAKRYLAVVHGIPANQVWTSRSPIGQDPAMIGRMRIDPKEGKDAETSFRVLRAHGDMALIEAKPVTGRTHQIRLHLKEAGHPVVGDELYGPEPDAQGAGFIPPPYFPLGLRAIQLEYFDPFQRKPVRIIAPDMVFLKAFGFGPEPEGGAAPVANPPLSAAPATGSIATSIATSTAAAATPAARVEPQVPPNRPAAPKPPPPPDQRRRQPASRPRHERKSTDRRKIGGRGNRKPQQRGPGRHNRH